MFRERLSNFVYALLSSSERKIFDLREVIFSTRLNTGHTIYQSYIFVTLKVLFFYFFLFIVCPPELQLNKANASDIEVPFLYLHLSISNGFVSSKIYDKRHDFGFGIVNFPFYGWGRSPFYLLRCLHFSTYLISRLSSHVSDFNARNKILTAKLLHQGYRYHKLQRTFS